MLVDSIAKIAVGVLLASQACMIHTIKEDHTRTVNRYEKIIADMKQSNSGLEQKLLACEQSLHKTKVQSHVHVKENHLPYDQMYRLIRDTLKPIGKFNKKMAFILLYTMAVETNSGKILYQAGGPARGIFQMEPATEKWILSKHPHIKKSNLVSDISYQIVLAEALYSMRSKQKLPNINDHLSVFKYYKQHWNTYSGSTTLETATGKSKNLFSWWNKHK